MSKKVLWLLYIPFMLLITGCVKQVTLEQTAYIPNQEWQSSFKPNFTFNITDSTKVYNIYLFIRHRALYEFNNLWVNIALKNNLNTNFDSTKYELSLSNNNLGWFGNHIGDIIEQYILLTPKPVKLSQGENQITIAQIMRQDPLKYVMNIGIRVEPYQ